jgi:formylglycine-generating enzyme required for sulfatase activity
MLPTRELPTRDAAFLSAARRMARRLRWRRGLAIGGIPLLLALFLVAAQLRARSAIRQQVTGSLTQARVNLQAARLLNQQTEQARQSTFATFDARHKEQGERSWDRMLALDVDTRQAYRRASKEAEAAFMLDSERPDVRDTLASILFERALVAERNHFLSSRDELLARVWLFDQDGSYRRRWQAPAVLQLTADPPGTLVSLTPIDDQRHLRSAAQRELGATPLAHLEVEPGAYLLVFRQPGRLEVRYPFLAQRGETLPIAVYLPHPGELPPGFLYIPAGRMLLGSDAEDGQRRDFLYHVPIHFAATGSFLIAQYETTYADWIAFLRALPAATRPRYLPRAGQPGISGALALRELPDGAFELTLQPTTTRYTAREGELLRFAAVRRRPLLHWERLPVTGISSEDAQAYVNWLATSGRVPNARLCTELEWERAARGADERHYPHSDELLPTDANFDQTYGQDPAAMGPDEVGAHPASRSIFGVDDMVGNAFEWVVGSISDKPYALRGGAYYYGGRTCRIDNRYEAEPTMRNPTVGVRMCATLSGPR